MAELLVWPALIAYGEAAVAYAGALARRRARSARLGIWGVRIGWLAQTALLIAQALDSDGFPWGTWAGALNLFVWLVVGAYLIWGCTPRYRLLGLAVMPLAAALLVAAWAGGGTGVSTTGHGRLAARPARRPDARRLRRADARRRARGPLPLAGAPAQAARRRACCACALPPLESLDRLSARTAFDLARASSRPASSSGSQLRARRLRRADGRHARDLGALRDRPASCAARWACAAAGSPCCSSPGSRLVAIVLPLTHFAS